MADPARQLDNEADKGAYDRSGSADSSARPDLKALEGGGETSEPKRGHLAEAGSKDPGREDLSAAESDTGASVPQHENQVGRGFTPGRPGRFARARARLGSSKTRTKAAIGMALATAVTSVVLFLALLPFKIVHMVDNLESHFFATSQNAVTKEVDGLFTGYLQRALLPGLNNCSRHSTISKDCQALTVSGTSPVTSLYRAWKTNKLETALADNYGTSFRYDTRSQRYFIKSPYLSKEVGFGGFDTKSGSVFLDAPSLDAAVEREVTPSEFNSFLSGLHKNLEDATLFKKVMYRFKMNGLLTKYGGWSRCIVACKAQAQFKESVILKKQAAKIKLAQRVLDPVSQQLSLIMQCLLAGCDLNYKTGQGASTGVNGEPRSPAEQQLYDELASLATKAGGQATLDAVAQATKDIREKGFAKYAAGEIFAKIVAGKGGSEANQQAARQLGQDAMGPVGWVNLASQLLTGLNKAGPTIKELGYAMNATAYAQMYMTYRTYADEIKSGNVDATEVGSFSDSLGPDNQGSASDPQVGGTAEAEQTPLYNYVMSGSASSGSSGTASMFSNTALAASSPTSYICKNGQAVPAGQLVCSEEQINKGSHALDSLHNFLNLPVIGQLTSLAGFLHNTVFQAMATVAGWFATAFSLIPGVQPVIDSITSAASSLVSPLFNDLVSYLIDIPVSSNMSGGRTFDAMAGGADVVSNDFSHHQLGGVELTNQQVADIQNQQNQQDLQNYQRQPFFARLFDSSSRYSLVTKLTMALPDNKTAALQSVGNFFTNPFGRLANMFSSLLSLRPALAATPVNDPFGITQYGYPADDPVFSTDPETYWQQHCTDNSYTDAWNNASISSINQDTMQPENPQQPVTGLANSDPKGTNPCLLIQTAVGSAGGLFDSSLLGSDAPSGSDNGGGGLFTNPFPDGWTPGRLDMGYDGHFTNQVVSPCDGTMVYVNPDSDHGDNGGWKGAFIAVKCSQSTGLPSDVFFFAEGLSPVVAQGDKVTAGQKIAIPGWTGYSEGPGGIEWGLANPNNPATVTLAESGINGFTVCSQASKEMVLNFAQWAVQNLGVTEPSDTSNAGCV